MQAAGELLPRLTRALAEDTVSVIACPVDYSENPNSPRNWSI